MKIISVRCKDFKTFDAVAFDLGLNTNIRGENGRGKTSIAEAIVYGLFGTNITGSAVGIDDYIRKGAKSMEVSLTVEIGGVTHEIERTKGKTSAVFLDGSKSDNNEIARMIGDKAEFLSVFTPGYFAALSNTDARAMVMGLVQMPQKAEVLKHLTAEEQAVLGPEALRDPEGWAKQVRDEVKAAQKEQERAKGQIELLEQRVSAEINQRIEWDDKELTALIAQRDANRSDTADQVNRLKTEISELRQKYSVHQAKLKKLPEAPFKAGDPCPTCRVPLTQETLDATLHTHALLVKQTETENAVHREAMAAIEAIGKELREQFDVLTDTAVEERDPLLDAHIGELEVQKFQVQQHNAKVEQMLQQRAHDERDLAEARSKLADYEAEETRLQNVIRALGNYRATVAELQVAQLKQHLDKVSIQLFTVTKSTGEIKPTFDLLYDGKEYRTLSYSERIRANLEIATLINKVRGWDWPVFIDNAESITHYVRPAATQVIEAYVVPEAALTVSTKGADAA